MAYSEVNVLGKSLVVIYSDHKLLILYPFLLLTLSPCSHSQINSKMHGAFTNREHKAKEFINNKGIIVPYEQAAQNTPHGLCGDTRTSIRFSTLSIESIDWKNLEEALDYENEGADTGMTGEVHAGASQVNAYPDGVSYSV